MESRAETLPIFTLSSRTLGGAAALRAFREATANTFEAQPDDLISDGDFQIDLRAAHLGCLVFAETRTCAQRFARSRRMVAAAGVDHIYMNLYTEGGSTGTIDGGRDFCARAGDISFFDLARPRETRSGAFRNIALVIPRVMLEKQGIDTDALHGFVLKRELPLAAMLAAHLEMLVGQAERLTPVEADRLGLATVAMIASMVGQSPEASPRDRTPASPRRKLLRYIDAHLGDPELGPSRLVEHFGLSRSALYRMFESEGGVAEAIRVRRLTEAAFALGSIRGQRQRISEVAGRLGFTDDTSFSRAFRAHFGIAPSKAREQSSAFWAGFRPSDGDPDLGHWLRTLRR